MFVYLAINPRGVLSVAVFVTTVDCFCSSSDFQKMFVSIVNCMVIIPEQSNVESQNNYCAT